MRTITLIKIKKLPIYKKSSNLLSLWVVLLLKQNLKKLLLDSNQKFYFVYFRLRTNSCNKFMPVQLPKSHLILMSIKFWARLKSNMKNHKKKKLNLNQNRSKSNRQSKMTKRKLRDHHLQLEQKNLNLWFQKRMFKKKRKMLLHHHPKK